MIQVYEDYCDVEVPDACELHGHSSEPESTEKDAATGLTPALGLSTLLAAVLALMYN